MGKQGLQIITMISCYTWLPTQLYGSHGCNTTVLSSTIHSLDMTGVEIDEPSGTCEDVVPCGTGTLPILVKVVGLEKFY